MMTVKIEPSWRDALQSEFDQPYFAQLAAFLHAEKAAGRQIFPPGSQIFRAFELCPLDRTRVVILGQDPYHGYGQAMGLCFSVPQGVPAPPSLKNIFKEIESDLGIRMSGSPDLTPWARQGVLLLNAVLTVREHAANSHRGKGWEILTDRVISLLNEREDPVIFLLWGRNAREKKQLVTNPQHVVMEAAHPSPLSAHSGFFGCGHFRAANDKLREMGKTPIRW